MRKLVVAVLVALLGAGAVAVAQADQGQQEQKVKRPPIVKVEKSEKPGGPDVVRTFDPDGRGDCVETHGQGGQVKNIKGDVLGDVPASIDGIPVGGSCVIP